MTATMSDTPRTDAADLNAIVYDKKVVFKEFAEQLERENEALRKLLVEAKKHIHHSDGCDYIHDSSARCDCNYLQLLSRIDAAIKEQSHD